MRTARLVVAILGFVALWPLAHRLLVAHYELHPWRLGGFAMYASYSASFALLAKPIPGGFIPLDEASFSEEVREALKHFRRERDTLGRLRQPDDVVSAVFEAQPDLEGLLVIVQRFWLDPRTAHIAQIKKTALYERTVFLEEGEASLELDLK